MRERGEGEGEGEREASRWEVRRLEYTGMCVYVSLPPLCLAMYPTAHAADSFTAGSNSSRHITKALRAPQSTTACSVFVCVRVCACVRACVCKCAKHV